MTQLIAFDHVTSLSKLEKLNIQLKVFLSNSRPSSHMTFSNQLPKSSQCVKIDTLWKPVGNLSALSPVGHYRFSNDNLYSLVFAPFRYMVLYDGTTDKLIAYADYKREICINFGEWLQVDWSDECYVLEW
jgi:hypothetical protein